MTIKIVKWVKYNKADLETLVGGEERGGNFKGKIKSLYVGETKEDTQSLIIFLTGQGYCEFIS